MNNELKNGISFTKAYATSDGKTFGVLKEAQTHELKLVFGTDPLSKDITADAYGVICDALLTNSAAIINVLSTTDKSRPKARKANGAVRKPRNSVTPQTA